ncbi:MAG: tRNA (N(6)-L-threonylcarbamoyladenosine(37)-C(2))-methylthiotransferase MtaB [Planctomycetota bacterium]|jgi:threonylcarbamoyladenosine tRNA methylthiotransferase MtaB
MPENGKFRIETLGCKVNQYESQAVRERLEQAGWREARRSEMADACVINTCTVTAVGDQKSRKFIRRMLRENPDARVLVTGCYVDRDADALKRIDERIEVIGNPGKAGLAALILAGIRGRETTVPIFDMSVAGHTRKARALLKIEDGCESFCSYCIVPHVRGPIVSRAPDEVIAEARRLVENGFRELVITGIHLGHYGKENPKLPRLHELLAQIAAVEGVGRIRLSSLEANEITSELVGVISSPVFCPHFHVPLQSGCDSVLKRMNRRYATGEFRKKMKMLRERFDYPAITSDIIVGFPGETENEFGETCAFTEEMQFARAHLFPFSPRPGTPAASMPDVPKPEIVKKRMAELDRITSESGAAYRHGLVGRMERVLFEREGDEQLTVRGRCDRYMEVLVTADSSILGSIQVVEIRSASEWFLHGKIN